MRNFQHIVIPSGTVRLSVDEHGTLRIQVDGPILDSHVVVEVPNVEELILE